MNDLIRLSTPILAEFLENELEISDPETWQFLVVSRLSEAQQRIIYQLDISSLRQLDFASLLTAFDQNWQKVALSRQLPKEVRWWVRELQVIRNRWAHITSEAIPLTVAYRDADTLFLMMQAIEAPDDVLDPLRKLRIELVGNMAQEFAEPTEPAVETVDQSEAEEIEEPVEPTLQPEPVASAPAPVKPVTPLTPPPAIPARKAPAAQPQVARKPYLVSKQNGARFALRGKDSVGRGSDCAITIDNPRISRFHATIELDGLNVYVTDLKSTNGTTINGKAVTGRTFCPPGAEIRFGNQDFSLEYLG